MTSALRSVLASALLLTPSAALAGLKVDSTIAAPKITFHANGEPGALDIDAVTNECTAADDGTTLTFTVPLGKLDTGIELRDEHMKDKFLLVGTYPNATLSFAKSNIAWPTELGKSAKGKLEAQFTAHGVTKPVSVTYDVSKTKQGYKATASFGYDISQHGIDVPSYLGVTVDAKQEAKAVIYLIDAP